ANALATDVTITDARGRATLSSLNANRISGPFQIRIVASKEQARAGMVSFQYIGETKGGSSAAATATTPSNHHGRWIAVLLVAGAGAAAGIVAGRSSSPSLQSSAGGGAPTPVPVVSIGAPSITVGHP